MRAASPPRQAASRSAAAPPSPPSSRADGFVLSIRTHGESGLEAKAILLAFGVRETPRSARLIGGDRPWGVITTGALQQFVYLQKIRPFRRAVIVGSELVAFSALLTLRHGGIAAAAMIEEGPRITARRPADGLARLALGVPVLTSTRLLAIHGIGKVEAVEIERAGKREHIACDGVVFTGRFRPETGILATSHIALDPASGGPAIDQYWRSSDPAVFVAGNLLHPVETAGVAWAEGRAAAEAIAAHLAGRLPAPAPAIAVTAKPPLRYVYPQRLVTPVAHLSPLLLKARADRAGRGRLRLLADGRELWSRRMSILPERRISLPVRSPAARGRDVDPRGIRGGEMMPSEVSACGTPLPIPPPQGGRGKNERAGGFAFVPRPLDGGGLGWGWAANTEAWQ